MALSARKRDLRAYIEALEDERRKIQMFSRELPLCLELITQAIEIRRQEMADDEYSGEVPVVEEFISLKPTSSSSPSDKSLKLAGDSKPDWLRSAQLWAPSTVAGVETSPEESSKLRKPVAKIGGAFQLLEKEKPCPPPASEVLESSITMENIAAPRKQRRCWSPELHRKFLDALEQLGGSQSGTPKQIRELMKVERLTNDEVKSHLQKYRLHTRRLPPTIQSSSRISPQIPPQFVLVGGILVPPPEYAVAASSAEQSSAAFNGLYTRNPQIKQPKQQKQLNNLPFRPSQSYEDDNNNPADHESETKSDSCNMSSASQTTTLPLL
ncbi:myb family transcription factor EFM-like [Phalaenopsis equestris]|uniref:myb family transcription factor EFM-like n=1 Tax=Phalaenopsis equestris TaxID=78828 RepID=UPI0009E411FB|nr:myb family transcription factor EFM-like [Phalaenopsis equestris]